MSDSQLTSMHPELDLGRTIRPGLDILANEIVIALKKRTRFAHNAPVYAPGLVRAAPHRSLLDYELHIVERGHAELGRYLYAGQESFSDVSAVQPVIVRETPSSPVTRMHSGCGPRIVEFYRQWIHTACKPGDDSNSYGETVTADVNALLNIMERVNLGKFVAESKIRQAPERFVQTGGDREAILALIRHRDREQDVFNLARRLAEHYQLAPEHAVSVFEFMVELTIDIEIDYIRMRLDSGQIGA
ncbi:MAG: hypothetical protein KDK91_15000 [Gammaproteobacteria bacterium]|nr:hypothetical protein [Gammaproteobacteria bacterium]